MGLVEERALVVLKVDFEHTEDKATRSHHCSQKRRLLLEWERREWGMVGMWTAAVVSRQAISKHSYFRLTRAIRASAVTSHGELTGGKWPLRIHGLNN